VTGPVQDERAGGRRRGAKPASGRQSIVLAVDQGSSSSRCVALDRTLRPLALASRPVASSFPRPGWVEHDADELMASVLGAVADAIGQADASWADVAGIGLAAQTETFVVWERGSGRPVYPAISWRDGRAAGRCDELRRAGHEPEVRERTGLPLQPAFSAAKLCWVLDSVPSTRRRAAAGELLFGDVNSWLTWNLSGGRVHATEPSMAARTMLFNLAASAWDPALLDLFGIPAAMLPSVTGTAGRLAVTDPRACGGRTVIGASVGDQQAALFGQRCWSEGMAKLTLGTGAFLWCHAGSAPPTRVPPGVVASCAWQFEARRAGREGRPGEEERPGEGERPGREDRPGEEERPGREGQAGRGGRPGQQTAYALEGFVPNAGGITTWLRQLGVLPDGGWPVIRGGAIAAAARRGAAGGMWCVPALFGLGTPRWDAAPRADLTGLTAATTAADVAEAALLGVAYQIADAIDAVGQGITGPLRAVRTDGGMSRNDSLLQAIADLTGTTLERPVADEVTALGAGALGGLGTDLWDLAALEDIPFETGDVIRPALPAGDRAAARRAWQTVLARTVAEGSPQP
jgi:glycerol kinase